jgi:MFS transporter, UMF1 family
MKGDKKVIRGWIFYDWANSVYNLVISSAIFPIFYSNITKKKYLAENPDLEWTEGMPVLVDFFGWNLDADTLIAYVFSASFLTISLLSPILSGIADYSGLKKRFMQFFCYLGALSCISLYWFDPNQIEWGMLSIFLASIGFWSSFVFYNAYLPEIAEPNEHDKISARGYAMGYFGSMILLIISLAVIMGIDAKYTSLSFILVGLWWLGFAQISFRALPTSQSKGAIDRHIVFKGFKELLLVLKEFKKTVRLQRYLRSFFFFNTGVQTVMLMAVYFAKKAIIWPDDTADSGLIIAILLIQLLGAGGAFLMSRVSDKIGNLKTLRIVVLGWILICVYAYFITTPVQFYILACSVGLVMGGVQALARSTYSKFLPKTTDTASYFSFYDVTEKLGIVFGTLFYGLMYQLTGNIRMSVVSIAAFFVLGFVFLLFVPKKEIEGIETNYVDNE